MKNKNHIYTLDLSPGVEPKPVPLLYIAIHGKKRSGKTTLAKMIQEKLKEASIDIDLVAFADKLKDACRVIVPTLPDGTDPFSDENKDNLQDYFGNGEVVGKPREMLQQVADAFRRSGNGIFMRAALQGRTKPCVISDLRFVDDIGYMKRNFPNTLFVKIKRYDEQIDNHLSEEDISDEKFAIVIENRGSLEDLEDRALYVAKLFELKRFGY